MLRWFFAFIFLLCYSVSSASPPETIVTIYGKGTRGPYFLGYKNIVSGTLRIFKDSTEIQSNLYTAQNIPGLVSFVQPIPVGDSLAARFKYVPFSLESQYFLHTLGVSRAESSEVSGEPSVTPVSFSPDLTVKGSKGFSIDAGPGAGGLSQSLNLTINGDIVSGLRTSAHISDKSAGGGAARRIEEIDKLYIEAESDYFKGTFGDFEYIDQNRGFMNFRRKLTGLNAGYLRRGYSVSAAAAFFPGEFSSMTINGVDGRLGPYYLQDIGGREGATVMSGSERVYIDGILQKRGSDNDYTIDYDAGAIEFAPSKVISSQTRITVDYEVARQEYSRSFYAGGGRTEIAPRLSIFGSLAQEGDRSGAPKSFEMTPENRQLLEAAGSDRLSAARSGAVLVGVGNGDYILQTDSLGATFYAFVGANNGDYKVTFSFIGKNEGSYRPRGGGVYDYVGNGLADYEPVILIPLPQVKRYGSAGVSFATADSLIFLETEMAGSMFDRNSISGVDAPLQGASGLVSAGLKRRLFGEEGFIGVEGKARSIGINSIFPGRIDAIERYRDYDLDPQSGPEGEKLKEIKFESGLDSYSRLRLEAGFLSRPGIRDRTRNAADVNWRLPGSIDWFGHIERTKGERVWWKRSSGLGFSHKTIQPSFRIDYESRDGDSGFKYYEYKTSVPARYFRSVSGSTDLTYRDEKYLESTWRDKFRSGSIQQKIEMVSSKTGFSGELAGSYFKKKYRDYAGTDSDQKSGSLRLSFADPGDRGEFFLSERLTSSNERLRTKTYIYVGAGEGQYRYEDGEYIEDPEGDYTLVIEELGEGARISDISTQIDASVSPLNIVNPDHRLESEIGRIVMESELAYNFKKSSDILVGRDFYPWIKGNSRDVLFNSGRIDLRFYFYPAGTKQRWKYISSRSFQNGNPYVNENVTERFRSDEISWAFPASRRIDMLISGLLSRKKSSINGAGYSIDRHGESLKGEYKLTDSWMMQSGAGFEAARQSDIDVRANIPSTEIGLIRDFSRKGRASINLSYYRVLVYPSGTYIPYQVAQGKREGDNLNAIAKARMEIYNNGRLDFLYRYEKFAKRPEKHNLKIEFTVLFQ